MQYIAPEERNGRLQRYLLDQASTLTIDADVHLTDTLLYPPRTAESYYHGRPLALSDLLSEMDAAQVSLANAWQNPAATVYPGGEDENAAALLEANRYILEAALAHPTRILPSGWTDPKACGVLNACRIVESCIRDFGFPIVKLNPAQNGYPIDSPPVLAVVQRIVDLGAIPAFHYGADTPFTPATGLERLALLFPSTPILAVHMGGGGASYLEAEAQYHASIALGLRHPNIRYIFSALRDTYIAEALQQYHRAGPPFTQNLFCASDAPYGRVAWNFGGFRALLSTMFDPDTAQTFLGGNFARFYASLLPSPAALP